MGTNILGYPKKKPSDSEAAKKIEDGDYGDIEVTGGGSVFTVESYGGVQVVPAGTNLQPIIDGLSAGSHVLHLGSGTYYGDSSSPSTPITIASTKGNVQFKGLGPDYTLIKSPILSETARLGLIDLCVRPDGTTYGVKIFKSGSFLADCYMHRVFIGASSNGAGDGPVTGLVLDGAGLFLAEQVVVAFCESHGLVVDSTAAEPNTTLKFDMCSFVQNGTAGSGYGIRILGSCSIAEFNGGNSEGNKSGEAYCESVNNIRFRDFDFESTETFDYVVHLITSNPVVIDNCNFFSDGSQVGAVLAQSCVGVHAFSNRFDGWSNAGIIRFDATSSKCHAHDNIMLNDCYTEDYSR